MLSNENLITYSWRGDFENVEVNTLHAETFGHPVTNHDWTEQLQRSVGWVSARLQQHELVGFVNVAWDGGVHAFILDTMVASNVRRAGVGKQLIATASKHAQDTGCKWLHVDFEDHLEQFYFDACGFRPTKAGLIDLSRYTLGQNRIVEQTGCTI